VPTAKSAAPTQPTPRAHISRHQPRRLRWRRLAIAGLGLVAGLTISLPAQTILAPDVSANAGPACPGYSSTTNPPDYIRVLRHRTGRVDKVPFKRYVLVVLGREWPGYLPQQAINAGAVAVKQYAWFHALGNGQQASSESSSLTIDLGAGATSVDAQPSATDSTSLDANKAVAPVDAPSAPAAQPLGERAFTTA